jgi:hypothetical protein
MNAQSNAFSGWTTRRRTHSGMGGSFPHYGLQKRRIAACPPGFTLSSAATPTSLPTEEPFRPPHFLLESPTSPPLASLRPAFSSNQQEQLSFLVSFCSNLEKVDAEDL